MSITRRELLMGAGLILTGAATGIFNPFEQKRARAKELVSFKDVSLVDPEVDPNAYAIFQQFPEFVNAQAQGVLDHNQGIGLEMHFSKYGSDLPSLTELKMEDVPIQTKVLQDGTIVYERILPNNTKVTLDGTPNEYGRVPLSWWRLPANKSFYLSAGEGEVYIFAPAYLIGTGIDASILQLVQIDARNGGLPDQHNNLVWIQTGQDPVVALGGFVPGHAIAIAMDAPNGLVAERLLYGQMAWNPNPPYRSTVAVHVINLETGAAGSWLSETRSWPQDRQLGVLTPGGSFPLESKFRNYR